MKNARVLIVEDDEHWIETFRLVLDGKVAALASATTVDAAITLLDKRYFNVAIVDLSLEPSNSADETGMRFLAAMRERGLDSVIAPIMCTGYGGLNSAVEALRDFKVVDFLPKLEFSAQRLTDDIVKALERHHILEPLRVEIEGKQSQASLWEGRDWALREDVNELAAELHDLLRRLFRQADQLLVRPLTTSRSGVAVLQVQLTYGAMASELAIVKFGEREKINTERRNYEQYIDRYLSSRSSTQLESAGGRTMAALRYRLIGTAVNEVQSFADFYARQDTAKIRLALDNLFKRTCVRWYDNRQQPRRQHNLIALYQDTLNIDWNVVWESLVDIGIDISGTDVSILDVPGRLPNPLHWLERSSYDFSLPVWLAVTHGNLDLDSIYVTADCRCWLVNFQNTGLGHILRDIVSLDVDIRMRDASSRSPERHYTLERSTWLAPDVDYIFSRADAQVVTISNYLRTLADDILGLEGNSLEYAAAYMLYCLGLLRANNSEEYNRNAFISAVAACTFLEGRKLPKTELGKKYDNIPKDEEKYGWGYTVLQTLFDKANMQVTQNQDDPESFSIEDRTGPLQPFGEVLVMWLPSANSLDENGLLKRLLRPRAGDVSQSTICLLIYEIHLDRALVNAVAHANRSGNIRIVPIAFSDIETVIGGEVAYDLYNLLLESISTWELKSDPFASNNSLQRSQWFFGVERQKQVESVLHDLYSGTTAIAIYGMRRIGKTAFLNRLVAHFKKRSWATAYMLCEPLGTKFTHAELLSDILRQWGNFVADGDSTLGELSVPYEAVAPIGFVDEAYRLLNIYRRQTAPAAKFVLILDEFDFAYPTMSSDHTAHEQYIRLAQQLKRLTEYATPDFVVIIACEYPWFNEEDHFVDYPGLENPLFHRFKSPRSLGCLSYGDWSDMMLTMAAMADIEISPHIAKELFDLTQGHPEISRQLGSCALHCKLEDQIDDLQTVEDLDRVIDYYMHPDGQYYRYLEVAFWNNPLSTDLRLDQEIMRRLATQLYIFEDKLLLELMETYYGVPADMQDSHYENSRNLYGQSEYIKRHIVRLVDLNLLTKHDGRLHMSLPLVMEWVRRYQVLFLSETAGD